MIYCIVPALGFSVCSRSQSSHNVFIMWATFKLPLPSTLSLLSRPDVFPPHAFPPAKQLLFKTTKNPTINPEIQTNRDTCVHLFLAQRIPTVCQWTMFSCSSQIWKNTQFIARQTTASCFHINVNALSQRAPFSPGRISLK